MFWENFINLCKKREKTPNGVAKELKISSGSITAWKNGRVPKWQTLEVLSSYFGTSVEELISNKEKEPQSHSNESDELNEYLEEIRTRPEMKMLFSVTKNASKEDVEKAVKVIEAMLEN